MSRLRMREIVAATPLTRNSSPSAWLTYLATRYSVFNDHYK
jgi:hypothetical protein